MELDDFSRLPDSIKFKLYVQALNDKDYLKGIIDGIYLNFPTSFLMSQPKRIPELHLRRHSRR